MTSLNNGILQRADEGERRTICNEGKSAVKGARTKIEMK
jgi:hypothetical protein